MSNDNENNAVFRWARVTSGELKPPVVGYKHCTKLSITFWNTDLDWCCCLWRCSYDESRGTVDDTFVYIKQEAVTSRWCGSVDSHSLVAYCPLLRVLSHEWLSRQYSVTLVWHGVQLALSLSHQHYTAATWCCLVSFQAWARQFPVPSPVYLL